jgi:hypothetical protein
MGYAAGTVLLRFAMMNPARKTKAANPAKTPMEGHRLKVVAGAP